MRAEPNEPGATSGLARRRLMRVAGRGLALTAAASVARPLVAGAASRELQWIAPRGYVETLDDWFHWTARAMGYYGDLDVVYQSGPRDGTACVTLIDQGRADASSPAPGVFALGLDRGMDILMVFSKHPVDIFSLAFRKGEAVRDVASLKGKTIVLGSIGWKPIIDTELAQFGIDPASVECVEAGTSWGQALAQGRGDAALCWEGQRATWHAEGLDFSYLLLFQQSRFPANGEDISRAELKDPVKHAIWADYLRGYAMGLEFGMHNPRAAAVIVDKQFPQLARTVPPSASTEHIVQLTNVCRGPLTASKGWGWMDPAQFQFFFDTYAKTGQITRKIKAADVISNEFVAHANDFDHAKVRAQAEAFKLPPEYAAVDMAPIRARNPARFPS